MENKIIKVEEEMSEGYLNFKDGTTKKVGIKTINTYYESGRKDCHIIMDEPIDLNNDSRL